MLTRPAAGGSEPLQFDLVEIEVEKIRDDVYVLFGVGGNVSAGNITVYRRPSGLLLVDSQYGPLGEKNLAAIRTFADEPVTHVVNTHMHVDHVGGNEFFREHGTVAQSDAVAVVAHERVLSRMKRPRADGGMRSGVWPTETYASAESRIDVGGETVRLLHQPSGHTDGDTFVYFPSADVVSAGDTFNLTRYPFIDRANGGSFAGIVEGLNNLVALAAASGEEEGATLIVPGHGRVAGEADVVEYRDMIVTIRDRIQLMIDSGMSLSEVQAARPTAEFDALYGHDEGFWTTGEFVWTVYEELAGI